MPAGSVWRWNSGRASLPTAHVRRRLIAVYDVELTLNTRLVSTSLKRLVSRPGRHEAVRSAACCSIYVVVLGRHVDRGKVVIEVCDLDGMVMKWELSFAKCEENKTSCSCMRRFCIPYNVP